MTRPWCSSASLPSGAGRSSRSVRSTAQRWLVVDSSASSGPVTTTSSVTTAVPPSVSTTWTRRSRETGMSVRKALARSPASIASALSSEAVPVYSNVVSVSDGT